MFLKKLPTLEVSLDESSDESNILFVADIQKKIAAHARKQKQKLIDEHEHDLDCIPDASGVHVVEHTGIHDLDEQTQNRMMRFMETHEAHQDQLRQTQRLEVSNKTGEVFNTVRVKTVTPNRK